MSALLSLWTRTLSLCIILQFSAAFALQSGGLKIPRSKHSDGITALLSESLENQRAQACEGEKAALSCPKHTQIQITSTFYGRLVPSSQFCPPKEGGKKDKRPQKDSSATGWEANYEDIACHISNANAKVTERCEHKRKCRVMAKPKTFGQDACPTTSKYLQIAYKCKPSEFNSANFCEGSPMLLSCNSKRRLALYSAVYGRTVDSQAVQCESSTAVNYDCTVDVLPALMGKCHAQKECSFNVDDALLGSPCPKGVAKYLTLIYMCVNENIFNEAALKGQLDSVAFFPPTAVLEKEEELKFDENFQPPPPVIETTTEAPTTTKPPKPNNDAAYAPLGIPEPSLTEPSTRKPRSGAAPPSTALPPSVPNAVGLLTSLLDTWNYLKAHQDKFLLYFTLSAGVGVALLLVFCICQLCASTRKQSKRREEAAATALMGGTADMPPSKYDLEPLASPAERFVFEADNQRVEMEDIGRNGVSFMRFNHPTPPRSSGASGPASLYGTYHRAPSERPSASAIPPHHHFYS